MTEPTTGLCRTTFPLADGATIGANALVLFDAEAATVRAAASAKNNRWTFDEASVAIDDATWADTLVPLPKEGFYELVGDVWIGSGQKLPEGLLVQLGYTKQGRAVVFPGVLERGTAIRFQQRGVLVTDLQLDVLRRSQFKLLTVAAPQQPPTETA